MKWSVSMKSIGATRRWLERSVIGLGLCPFAESVYTSQRVRFRVSGQSSAAGLLQDLQSELLYLHAPRSEYVRDDAADTSLCAH